MNGRGRPLRFLALVCLGWIGLRVVLLWPQAGSLPAAIRTAVPFAAANRPTRAPARAVSASPRPSPASRRTPRPASEPSIRHRSAAPTPYRRASDAGRLQTALLNLYQFEAPEPAGIPSHGAYPLAAGLHPPLRPGVTRWSGSGWIVARGGAGLPSAPGGQLGGGQAGARIAFLLSPRHRLAAFGRVATPLSGTGREAALGLEWQPLRAPVRLVVERRFALDGGRGGPGVGLVGGIDLEARDRGGLVEGFRLEAYAQAGGVARRRLEPYADAAARLTRRVAGGERLHVTLGLGLWGAAQRDAARLDAGPSAGLTLPIADRSLRLALDWRQRVAGHARPGSGPAVTLGSDF